MKAYRLIKKLERFNGDLQVYLRDYQRDLNSLVPVVPYIVYGQYLELLYDKGISTQTASQIIRGINKLGSEFSLLSSCYYRYGAIVNGLSVYEVPGNRYNCGIVSYEKETYPCEVCGNYGQCAFQERYKGAERVIRKENIIVIELTDITLVTDDFYDRRKKIKWVDEVYNNIYSNRNYGNLRLFNKADLYRQRRDKERGNKG